MGVAARSEVIQLKSKKPGHWSPLATCWYWNLQPG
jgi:hypothetical protein